MQIDKRTLQDMIQVEDFEVFDAFLFLFKHKKIVNGNTKLINSYKNKTPEGVLILIAFIHLPQQVCYLYLLDQVDFLLFENVRTSNQYKGFRES